MLSEIRIGSKDVAAYQEPLPRVLQPVEVAVTEQVVVVVAVTVSVVVTVAVLVITSVDVTVSVLVTVAVLVITSVEVTVSVLVTVSVMVIVPVVVTVAVRVAVVVAVHQEPVVVAGVQSHWQLLTLIVNFAGLTSMNNGRLTQTHRPTNPNPKPSRAHCCYPRSHYREHHCGHLVDTINGN